MSAINRIFRAIFQLHVFVLCVMYETSMLQFSEMLLQTSNDGKQYLPLATCQLFSSQAEILSTYFTYILFNCF